MSDHDFGPAVARLIDGGSPPPESWGGPPRPLPPRPVPRHMRAAAPTPRQRAATARADQRALPAFRLHQWRLVDVTRETTFTLPAPKDAKEET